MLSWARKRQLIYGASAVFLFALIFAAPLISSTIRGPSCSDGRQNGGETGVDCGGGCALLCPNTAREPRVLWQRVFREGGGIASAVFYAENLNQNAGAFDAPYQVKVYDSVGLLIAEKRVTATIPPDGPFAVFAPNLFVGERIPARAFFERTSSIVWRRDVLPASAMRVLDIRLSTSPQARVDARIITDSQKELSGNAVAIVYDASGNAIGASGTIVEEVSEAMPKSMSFIWRAPFSTTPVRAEVLLSPLEYGAPAP